MKFRMIIESYDANDPLDFDSKHKAYTDIIWISTEQYDKIIDIATEGIRKAGKSWRKTTAKRL